MYGVGFLTFNILKVTKTVSNLICDWFYTPIIFNNPVKTAFSIRNILFTICVLRVWIVAVYFLFEKQSFIGLLKMNDKQTMFWQMIFLIAIVLIIVKVVKYDKVKVWITAKTEKQRIML